MQRKRPEKRPNLLKTVQIRIMTDRYIPTVHAKARQAQRSITLGQIKYVLCHGRHEKSKDKYEESYGAWNYAIRGTTFDEIDLRVIISFDEEDDLLIITAFEIEQGG